MAWGLGGVLLLSGLVAWLVRPRWPDPLYEGRHASRWFRLMLRSVDSRGVDSVELQYLEARKALLGLGTNAAPMLADHASARDPDSPLRRLLRNALLVLPMNRPPPPGARSAEALALLEALRPPATLVRPWLEADLTAGGARRERALRVLVRCRDDALIGELVEGELLDGKARPEEWVRSLVAPLDRLPASAAATLSAALERPASAYPAMALLSRVGPDGKAAVPVLERWMAGSNAVGRWRAAFVLREIDPSHAGARQALEELGRTTPFDAWNQLTQTAVATVLADVGGALRVTDDVSRAAVESLARAEVEGWEPKGLAHAASLALERVAPARAAPLYAAQVRSTNRMNVRIVAAACLLRTGGEQPEAFGLLTNMMLEGDPAHLRGMAADGVGELDPRWRGAVRDLERLVGPTSDAPWVQGKLEVSLERVRVRAEEAALAR